METSKRSDEDFILDAKEGWNNSIKYAEREGKSRQQQRVKKVQVCRKKNRGKNPKNYFPLSWLDQIDEVNRNHFQIESHGTTQTARECKKVFNSHMNSLLFSYPIFQSIQVHIIDRCQKIKNKQLSEGETGQLQSAIELTSCEVVFLW